MPCLCFKAHQTQKINSTQLQTCKSTSERALWCQVFPKRGGHLQPSSHGEPLLHFSQCNGLFDFQRLRLVASKEQEEKEGVQAQEKKVEPAKLWIIHFIGRAMKSHTLKNIWTRL